MCCVNFVCAPHTCLAFYSSRQKTENWLVGECRPFSTENVVTNRRFRNNIALKSADNLLKCLEEFNIFSSNEFREDCGH